ncbi:hypothetical protein A2U01_0079228 [Trifolium medium]|uniref:Uncharacterized protein n=1 Tax=Trifolium medium TaxID=97028 RepID=A0A392TDF9_9FABA|nr:hypothetical protein [Trifolium medium]
MKQTENTEKNREKAMRTPKQTEKTNEEDKLSDSWNHRLKVTAENRVTATETE